MKCCYVTLAVIPIVNAATRAQLNG